MRQRTSRDRERQIHDGSRCSRAVITLYRPAEATNVARRYKIYVDGKKVGAIGVGKTVEIAVPAGQHTVKAKIDWCSSPDVAINVAPGQHSTLTVGTAGWIFTMLANQLFRPSRYLVLETVHA